MSNLERSLLFPELHFLACLPSGNASRNKLQATSVLPNLTNTADLADSSLVLCLILASIEGTHLER